MKNSIFISLFFTLVAIFFSCKEGDIVTLENSITTGVPYNGQLYLNLNLASADRGSTRAYNDDDFITHPGFDYESTILNGKIYVFEGTSESDAFCVSSGSLTDIENSILTTGKQFSTSWIPCRNIKLNKFDYDPAKTYFALVILNANDKFVFPNEEEGEKFSDWAYDVPQVSNMVIEDKNGYEHPLNKDNNNNKKRYTAYYPTMTNASGHVGFNGLAGRFNPTTLVKIDNSDFTTTQKTESDAIGTSVYVQRNVARVLLQPSSSLNFEEKEVTMGDPKSEEYWQAEVNISNWALDIINTKTYPVMKIDGIGWHNRVNSVTKVEYMHLGDENFERCLWAKDPNYDNLNPSGDFKISKLVSEPTWMDARAPLYCLENTFNPQCMLQGQTTRLLMRGRWAFNEITDNNLKDKVKIPGGVTGTCYKSILEKTENGNAVGFYIIKGVDKVWCRAHIEEALTNKAKELYGECSLKFTWKAMTSGGYFTLPGLFDEIEISKVSNPGDTEDYKELTSNELSEIAGAIGLTNINDQIKYYYNCVSFYSLRIPHFKEEDVPWNSETEVKTKEDGTWIAKYEPKHLGRYGVVRNYSYTVTVNAIHNLGEPCIPEVVPDDTDDMPGKLYLDLEVKVNAWAKHDVTVGF